MDQLRHLLDLDDHLLVTIASHAASPADLCRLAASNAAFTRLILHDAGTAEIVWVRQLAELMPDLGGRRASAALFRTLSKVSDLRWSRVKIAVTAGSQRHGASAITASPREASGITASLCGRTGGALCRIGEELLLYGGTLNGNAGPVLGSVLAVHYHRDEQRLRLTPVPVESEADESSPGPRRGHTMTAASVGGGTRDDVGIVLGGWSYDDVDMAPVVLKAAPAGEGAGAQYAWRRPATSGQLPAGRAFHSATAVARCTILVYGGLGRGCCRTDIAVLDAHGWAWSAPRVDGAPRCLGGRAGHGAAFFPSAAAGGGATHERRGELLLLSGASRSSRGDAHQDSVDALEVCATEVRDEAGAFCGVEAAYRWSTAWGGVQLPSVRTATYVSFARSVACWSGIGEGHEPEDSLHVVDVDRRCARRVPTPRGGGRGGGAGGAGRAPAPRGGAVAALLSPFEAVVLCGSDHADEVDEMLAPHVLSLALPSE